MNLKSLLAKPLAAIVHKQIRNGMQLAVENQEKLWKELVGSAAKTIFGKDHHFQQIESYDHFQQAIPIRDYEQFKSYIEQIKEGKHNVLWKGQPIYLAKTSGTTSGVKYIPITKDSISNHIHSARNALLCYMFETGN
jgi:hypothetical protein